MLADPEPAASQPESSEGRTGAHPHRKPEPPPASSSGLSARLPRMVARWILILFALGAVGAVVAAVVLAVEERSWPAMTGLGRELRDRGRVVVVGDDPNLLQLEAEGCELLLPSPAIRTALAGHDEEALTTALRNEGIAGLLVDVSGGGGAPLPDASLRERLRGLGNMESLSGAYLTPSAALYLRRRAATIEPPYDEAMARVARQLLGGAPMPRIRAFPEPLRHPRNVEVMVMLERDGRPRLWRSARGGSLARALMTAASVARQRWNERERAMQRPLDEALPRLTVRVYLLEEDGTLGDTSERFLQRVFTDVHGVAYEEHGSWHYKLPRATRRAGSPLAAYEQLFADEGEAADSLGRQDIRFYRLVARQVAVSRPSISSSSARPAPAPDGSADSLRGLLGGDGWEGELDLDSWEGLLDASEPPASSGGSEDD